MQNHMNSFSIIRMLLIIYETFTMNGSPFRIVAFGDQIAVQIFPKDILHLL